VRREFKLTKPATLDSIADETARLYRHIESLAKAVDRLADRIQPAEGIRRASRSLFEERYDPSRPPKPTIEAILKILILADDRLRGAELDIQAIRAVMDQISNDSWSRDDLKQWIDTNKKS
jgi:hypothetical protein